MAGLRASVLKCAGPPAVLAHFAKLVPLFAGAVILRRSAVKLVPLLALAIALVANSYGQTTQPFVAVHDSELTRALENMNAVAPTPTGPGTTGKQWWPTDWHYFVMPESVKEALKSDGTSFTVVGDSNVSSGVLLNNGQPRYPIVISLASEAIRDDEIGAFTNYVAAGGFLFVGSSAFTRNTNGVSRGDFAIANQLGMHLQSAGLTNWASNNNFTKTNQPTHRLVSDIPAGQLTWRMPSYSEEIPWGISPNHPYLAPHDVWLVKNSGATVLAQGDASPFLAVRQYGKGYFIYCAAFQPLIGHSGFAPSMYAYLILRRSIEWAFESANLPIPKLSPWPYQYDAAFMVRHDLENFTNEIAAIEASAQVEFTNGAKGDYYFCTGTVRDDASPTYNTNNIVAGLRRAVTNYNATIGPHNGGLKNPNNSSLVRGQYDYWHWGPDEALDVTPPGYSSGKVYALTSISNSFKDVESWLKGITNGLRTWVGCYFNATRENSYDLQAQLGVNIAGDQKLTPFPHWTVSTVTPNKRYSFLSEPVSDWFVGGLVAQSLEPWHPPGVQTSQTMHDGIDFYYKLGALVNFYSHTLSTGLGDAGSLVPDYVSYCANTNFHPRMWAANAVSVYQWWLQRSNVQASVVFTTNGVQSSMTFNISGAVNANTALEMYIPGTNQICGVQVFTNGVAAGSNIYRLNGQIFKLLVGTKVTNAVVTYYPLGAATQVFSQSFDSVTAPALPAGWITNATGVESPWVTQSSVRDTTPNAAFVPDPSNIGSSDLISPPISIPSGTAQLSFQNNYDFETGPGTDGFDGGVLEIKIGAAAFADIVTAGGIFISGGYNSTIDPAYSNPLAGRPAWSGNSGGFIPTLVLLPNAASGQTIQLRWRAGTDNSNGATGWRIDTISISSRSCACCGGGATNAPPTLPAQVPQSVVALTTLTVTNTAADADTPPQTLSYQLIAPPAGAAISSSGIITWTPAAGQGNTTNVITTVVTDSGTPPLSATNNFTVTVTPANTAPILPNQSNITIPELTTLVVTNAASDDGPQNALSYRLLVAPAGATISSNGIISWSPTEAQGPSTNLFTTVVTDSGTPPLSATNSFTVFVTEMNSAPTLPLQPNRTISELTTLVVTNTASDTDIPANVLTYLLIGPAGAAISSSGVITWTPTEAQGPGTNSLTTIVTDNASPPLSATNAFTVVVTEINTAPVLPVQTNRSVIEATPLIVTNTATDSDIPANNLFYTLVNPPAGASIDTNGIITWTPTPAQGPGTNVITTIVTDDGNPPLGATNTFTVSVIDTNTPPVITSQPASLTNNAGTTATFSVTATGTSLAYQWQKGTTPILNATSSVLTLGNVSDSDAGGYSVIVTNPLGSVTSLVATLTIIDPPVIQTQPVSRTNNAGTLATFTVTVLQGTLASYQWRKNGLNLNNGGNVSGATTSALSLGNVSGSDAGNYTVVITNAAGAVTSSVAALTVISPPAITTQPFSATNSVGTTANFTVAATGTSPVYQWIKDGTNALVDAGNITGSGSTSLTISNVALDDGGTYTVLITNSAGSVTSAPAVLTVTTNPPGQLFADDFTRATDPGPISPWIVQSGTWTVTGGALQGGTNALNSYGYAYISNVFANFTVQGQVRFQAGGYGGGLGACLNRSSGAHYAAWIFPEGSSGGSNVLKLIKFQKWNSFKHQGSSAPLAQVSLATVGTNWHTLSLTCSNRQIIVLLDGTQLINVTDTDSTAYLSGGITAGMWTDTQGYQMWVDNVTVTSLTATASNIAVVAPPQIQNITVTNGYAAITWTATSNNTYRLQYKEDLATTNWSDVSGDVLADGLTASKTDTVGNGKQRFYRVMQVQ